MQRIYFVGDSNTVLDFTIREAVKYVNKITKSSVTCEAKTEYNPEEQGIWICSPRTISDITYDEWDDAISIKAVPGHVRISGTNDRSVLFALYDWLEELGCRWIMPGRGGEIIPFLKNPLLLRICKYETASYRHRCICIEGSCSKEHVLNMADFAAKKKFNAYFLQFRNSFTFFERWYGLEKNRASRKTSFSISQAEEICAVIKKEVLKRGMLLHMVGHGWTCEPFGIPGLEWAPFYKKIKPSVKKYFAMVDGKRELWHGIPLNTQLCYSNPTVREIMARSVADYADAHQNEKIIHVWLADGSNNFCECSNCRKHRHSDLYVKLLNRIDELLTARKITTRIVFLAYVDLLWAPLKEKIHNPDRFILMFAPITRSYAIPFLSSRKLEKERIMPWKRNKLVFPSTPRGNLELFYKWRRAFNGEQVDFDYHLWRAWAYDPSQLQISEILHADIRALQKIGMNGFISCQVQRLSFPTAFPLYVLGETLWNRNLKYKELVADYYRQIYGDKWQIIFSYLKKMEKFTHPLFLRGDRENSVAEENVFADWQKVLKLTDSFILELQNEKNTANNTNRLMRLLQLHAEYVKRFISLAMMVFRSDKSASVEYKKFAGWLDKQLPEINDVLDTWLIKGIVQGWLSAKGIPYEENIN